MISPVTEKPQWLRSAKKNIVGGNSNIMVWKRYSYVTIGCTKKYTVSDTNYGISLSNFEMGVRQKYAHGRDYQNEVPYLNILNR